MRDAVIVTSLRTAVGKALRGALREVRPDEMAAAVIKAAVERTRVSKGRWLTTSCLAVRCRKENRE